MGNSSTKEARPASALSQHSRHEQGQTPTSPSFPASPLHDDRAARIYGGRSGRGSRHDLPFLGSSRDAPTVEPVRRETKAEREARRLEKERILREKERERSMREENVDGGFLVTLGTYIGPEDFSKPLVRQLMIERRIAPFWKGLNDHSDSWLDHQLIAAVQDKPIPAANDIPLEESNRAESPAAANPRSSDLAINTSSINHLTVPISSRSQSTASDQSILSPSHPAFSSTPITSSNPFRSRARSLVGLSSSKNNSQVDITRQEINLPNDLYIHGHRVEAFLYKNASECPICFLYYPPYLNKTRCCDQPICSECFVQIKRPDPHPPEHHEPNNNAEGATSTEQPEDNQLVSEPAACPFCVQPEFGVTYEAPPFRRGLVYPHAQGSGMGSAFGNVTSAMSSTTSLNSPGTGRRRTTSLSANCSSVISTDRVRPDWAKKLADARSHAQRRAAAATALHNAAYVLGQSSVADARGSSLLGRRRRTIIITDSPGGSGNGTPRLEGSTSTSITALFAAAAEQNGTLHTRAFSNGQSDQPFDQRQIRRNRLEDLEELMMMEAIRLSLAAEEERKRKEEKDFAKEAKKEEKKRAKEAKKASRKSLFFGAGPQEQSATSSLAAAAVAAAAVPGKGKSVDRGGSVSPPSVSQTTNGGSSRDDTQRHLEQSRAKVSFPAFVVDAGGPSTGELGAHRDALRQLSVASSSVSSLVDSIPDSLHRGNSGFGASNSSFEASPNVSGLSLNSNPEATTSNSESPGTEPMFNFRSLAAVIGSEDGEKDGASRIEDVAKHQKSQATKGMPTVETGSSSDLLPSMTFDSSSSLEQSVVTIKPSEGEAVRASAPSDEDDSFRIEPVPVASEEHNREFDQKHYGVEILDSSRINRQPTQ